MSQFIRSPMAALAFGASRLTPTPPSGRGVGTTRTTTCSTRRFSFPSGTRGCVVFASADDTHPSRKNEKPETNSMGNKGFVKGSGVLTMDQLLEVPIKRFKPTSEECPFCRDAPVKENGSKCLGICRNPQNVPGPLIFPHEMQEVTDAVRLQINALRENDEPRSHHGVQVMWEFSVESGNMERSRYFGMTSDMYHYDHFIGKSLKFFGPLVRNKGVTKFCDVSEMDDGRTMVKVEVADDVNKPTFWVFIMVKRSFGKYNRCWQSHRVVQTDASFHSEYLEFI